MDILIYGAGVYCENLLNTLKQYKFINVIGIADSSYRGEKYGYKILDLWNCQEQKFCNIAVVIAMANKWSAYELAYRLRESGYEEIYLYLNKTRSFSKDFFSGECVRIDYSHDIVLPSVELHVVDFCNLNCKGCAHFSPLFEKAFPDLETRLKDLYLLKKIYHNILVISLLGGEPFASPEVDKYIIEARKCFPNAEIQVVTNGLLLLSAKDELLKIIAENKITISISEYEPTHQIIEKIKSQLDQYKIDYSVRHLDRKRKFNRPLTIVDNSKYNRMCISDGCVAVREGKIAKCPTLLYLYKFNEKFGQKLPTEGILKIQDYTDGEVLNNKLRDEVPLCKYCVDYEIDWGRCDNNVTIEDFASLD